jgi:hypothetical protein
MSIAENPLLGPMRKSMANFTTMSYGGRNIIRSKAFKPNLKQTEKQKKHQELFKMLAEVYRSFGGMTNLGFIENSGSKNPYNLFMAANLSTAIDKTGEVPVILYTALLVANGSLPLVKVTEASIEPEGIMVQYKANLGYPKVSATDELIACALLQTGELLVDRHPRGNEATGTMLLSYPNLQAGEVEGCYVFARSGDGKKASKSVYVDLKR